MDGGDNQGVFDGGFDAEVAALILDFLQQGRNNLAIALESVNQSVATVRALQNVPMNVSRALEGIVACENTFHQSLQQIQTAVAVIVPMVQVQPILLLGLQIDLVAEAHEVVNATAVSLHSFVLALTKAHAHGRAQSDLHSALSSIHCALAQFQRAIGCFRYPNEIAAFDAVDHPELEGAEGQ